MSRILSYNVCSCYFRDSLGRSAVWYAAEGGYDDCLYLLLQGRADPSTADRDGVTPLMVAAAKGHVAVIQRYGTRLR